MPVTVVNDTSIYAQIWAEINSMEESNVLGTIQISEAEMKQFLADPRCSHEVAEGNEKYYGENVLQVPVMIERVKAEGDVPRSCWFRGTKIVVV